MRGWVVDEEVVLESSERVACREARLRDKEDILTLIVTSLGPREGEDVDSNTIPLFDMVMGTLNMHGGIKAAECLEDELPVLCSARW